MAKKVLSMAQTGAEVEKFHDVQVVSVPATIVTSHALVEGGLSLVSCFSLNMHVVPHSFHISRLCFVALS